MKKILYFVIARGSRYDPFHSTISSCTFITIIQTHKWILLGLGSGWTEHKPACSFVHYLSWIQFSLFSGPLDYSMGYTTLNPQINWLAFLMICIDFNILQNYLQVSTTYNQMIVLFSSGSGSELQIFGLAQTQDYWRCLLWGFGLVFDNGNSIVSGVNLGCPYIEVSSRELIND